MRRTKFRLLVGLVALLGMFAAACGSDDDTSTSEAKGSTTTEASSSSSSGAVRGVTDTEIVIAGISPVTSPTGGYPGVDVGAAARFARVNAEGGINGRKIKYLGTRDDTEAGAKNLDLARKAVLEDKVFAIVPALGQGFLPATGDFLNKEKVPSVGWGFMPLQCSEKPDFGFGFNGCIVPPGGKIANTSTAKPIIDKLGKGSTAALVSDDTDTSRVGNKVVQHSFEAAGAKVVYQKANVPTSERVDYTPFVQDIMTSNDGKAPEIVVFNGRFANTVGITAGLRAAGFKGATVNYITYVPGLLDAQPDLAKALDGSYIITQFLPVEFTDAPAIKQMKKDIESYKAGAPIQLGTALSYWMADSFVQMLQSVGKDLTPDTFDKVINGGWTYKPEGTPPGIGPVKYPEGHSEPSPCGAMVQIKDAKYVPVTPLTCYENIKVSG